VQICRFWMCGLGVNEYRRGNPCGCPCRLIVWGNPRGCRECDRRLLGENRQTENIEWKTSSRATVRGTQVYQHFFSERQTGAKWETQSPGILIRSWKLRTSGACSDWKKASELGNKNAADLLKRLCH